jgi:hypothetical protein
MTKRKKLILPPSGFPFLDEATGLPQRALHGVSALSGFLTPTGETRLILQAAEEGIVKAIASRTMNRHEAALVRFLMLPEKAKMPCAVVGTGRDRREVEFQERQQVITPEGVQPFGSATSILSSPQTGHCLSFVAVAEWLPADEEAAQVAVVYSPRAVAGIPADEKAQRKKKAQGPRARTMGLRTGNACYCSIKLIFLEINIF